MNDPNLYDAGGIKQLVVVDRVVNGNGVALYIVIEDRQHMKTLTDAAERLANGLIRSMYLDDLFPVHYNNVDSLRLELKPGTGWIRKSVFDLGTDGDRNPYLWSTTTDGWYQNAGLLAGLTGPGHQYFGHDLDDDAEIVVSFKEGLQRACTLPTVPDI